MSDVTVANPGSAPPPAPAQHQIPINTNPTSHPNPVGSQAPEAPVGDFKGSPHRPRSVREDLQAAFDRAANPTVRTDRPKAEAKPAEARMGHNNPPEDLPKIDLRKRPPTEQQQRERGEHGRFVPRQQQEGSQSTPQAQGVAPRARQGQPQPQQPQQGQQQLYPQARQLPNHVPYAQPVNRMSDRAKYDWASAPESVRADVHRMHKEFTEASNYFKADHEAMKPLRAYHQLAQSQGTTLDRALYNYVSMENKLRSDPIGGLDTIVNNLNLKGPDGQRIGLRDIAYHVLSQTPDQLRAMQQGNQQQAAAQQITALNQQVNGLQNQLAQMQYNQQSAQVRGAVDYYAAQRPRFDELGDLIEKELRLGFDLDTAYRRAELLRPATHATQNRNTPAQTRPIDRSISGAPAAALGEMQRRKEPSKTPREAVQNAINRLNGWR